MGVARSGIGWLITKYGALILSFASLMYFTRVLSEPTRILGLFQVFESIVSMILIASSSGLSLAVTKRVSERTDESEILGATAVITVGIIVFLSVAVLLAADVITSYFEMGFVIVALLLVILWAQQIGDMAKAALRGASRVGQAGGVSFVELSIRAIAQIVLVFLGFELLGLVAGVMIGAVAAAGVAVALVPYNIEKPSRDQFSRLFSFTKYTYFQGFADKVYMNVDTFVIAGLMSSQAVSLYNVPFRLTLALSTFAVSISSVVLPEISERDAKEDPDRVREVLKDAIIFSTILAIPALVGVGVLAKPLIVTLFTGEFAAGATVAIVAMAIQIPESLRSVFSSVILGIDKPAVSLRSSVLLVSVNIILDIVLVLAIGIEGAAVATLIAVSTATAYLAWNLLGALDLGVSFLPVKPLAAQVVAAGVMGSIVALLKAYTPLATTQKLAFLIGTGVVVYWAILLAISPRTRRRTRGIVLDVLPMV